MKKIIIITFIFLMIVIGFSLFYTKNKEEKMSLEEISLKEKKLIEKINEKYIDLKSYKADLSTPYLTGVMSVKTPQFRITVRSLFGKEADIGCNKEKFWYWFKRNDATHQGGLDDEMAFVPLWLADCFGMKVNVDGKILYSEKHITLVRKKNDLILATVFDKEITKVNGHYIYRGDELVASCDMTKLTEDGLPESVTVTFQNNTFKIKLKNHKINSIEDSQFNLPF